MLVQNYEDRIRDLCARLSVSTDEEWMPLVLELKAAIHDHLQSVKVLAAGTLKAAETLKKEKVIGRRSRPTAEGGFPGS